MVTIVWINFVQCDYMFKYLLTLMKAIISLCSQFGYWDFLVGISSDTFEHALVIFLPWFFFVVEHLSSMIWIFAWSFKHWIANWQFLWMHRFQDVDWHTLQSMLIAFKTTHGSICEYMQKVNMQDFDSTHSIWNYTCIKEH